MVRGQIGRKCQIWWNCHFSQLLELKYDPHGTFGKVSIPVLKFESPLVTEVPTTPRPKTSQWTHFLSLGEVPFFGKGGRNLVEVPVGTWVIKAGCSLQYT